MATIVIEDQARLASIVKNKDSEFTVVEVADTREIEHGYMDVTTIVKKGNSYYSLNWKRGFTSRYKNLFEDPYLAEVYKVKTHKNSYRIKTK